MKNTFKFEVSNLYYIIGLFCFFTGYFKDFIWISLLIIIHEFGHLTGAILCNWKIERVVLLPFGGMTLFKESLNRPIYQEWIIVLLGPVYQSLFFLILQFLNYANPTFQLYHFLLLGFNLLPMIPLDGGKMLQLCLESIFPYRYAKFVGLAVSISLVLILMGYMIITKNVILGIILLSIIKENIKFYKQIPYQMEKFLLERYLNPFSYKKYHKIKRVNLYAMRRGYSHLFWNQNTWKTEREILNLHFQRKAFYSFDKIGNV